MPDRMERYDALILRAKESPAGHRILSLLTAEEGLVDVFMFGGAKSSLRSSASPYVAVKAFVYFDPVRNYRKLNDLSIVESFQGIRESYEKLRSASVIAEIAIKTQGCGGEYQRLLELCLASFRSLDKASEKEVETILLGFLWKSLGIMGLQPELTRCASCGKPIRIQPGAAGSNTSIHYSPSHDGFLCPACETDGITLQPEDLGLLKTFGDFAMEDCGDLCLESPRLESIQALVYYLSQKAAEGVLLSLEAGH